MARAGSWSLFGVGLPEFGLTEKLGGIIGAPRTAQGGSNIFGGSQAMVSPAPSGGQVMGAQSSGGGPGGAFPPGRPASQQSIGGQPSGGQPSGGLPLEQNPEQPDFSAYDQAIAQAQEALNIGEQAALGSRDAAITEAEASGQQQTKLAQQAQSEKLGGLGEQRTRESGRAENAIAQARQQAAEMQQGLQARFGKSTGTGAFVGELTGRAALQNIGGIQQGLQQTMTQINQEEQNVRNVTANLLSQISQQTENAKVQARSAFDQARAEIASRKGELQSRKAELMMNALQSYQQLLQEVEARNTAFKQQLYQKAQATQQQLDTFKNQALQKFQAQWEGFQPPTWNVGGNTVAAFPSGADLRGVTYMTGKKPDEEAGVGSAETGAAAALGL